MGHVCTLYCFLKFCPYFENCFVKYQEILTLNQMSFYYLNLIYLKILQFNGDLIFAIIALLVIQTKLLFLLTFPRNNNTFCQCYHSKKQNLHRFSGLTDGKHHRETFSVHFCIPLLPILFSSFLSSV